MPVMIVGLGGQGNEHLDVCLARKDLVEVVAVCDPLVEKMDLPGLPPFCRRLPHWRDALIMADTGNRAGGAAIVAVPPHLYKHELPMMMEAGLHILVEKPLGMDLEEAIFLVDCAETEGVVLAPAVQRRFHPSYLELARIFSQQGPPSEALLVMELDKTAGGWRRDHGVGILFDLGFHALDLARALFGDLHLISSSLFDEHGRSCHHHFDARADVLFRTESGTFLRVVVARSAKVKREFLEARLADGTSIRAERGLLRCRNRTGEILSEKVVPSDWTKAMDDQLQTFVADCRSPGDNHAAMFGLATMKLLEEAYALASTT